MTELGHLQIYDLILTTRSPLYVGSGKIRGKTEYLFNPRSGAVQMLDTSKFFACLIERGLADQYEHFVFSGDTRLYDFLRGCGLTDSEISDLCLYRIDSSDALDGEHSLKEIHTFIRDAANRVYVPGSSVKGALRTVILSALIERTKLGSWPDQAGKGQRARQMQTLEGEYLNTLDLKRDKKGTHLNDAVNSIMRGIMVSDSLPVSDKLIMLSGKTDALPNGETRELNLCRECIRPGASIRFKLTLDRSVLDSGMDAAWIMDAIQKFDVFYKENFLSCFTPPTGTASVSYDHCLILGGGSGFFAKALPYQFLGLDRGLSYTASEMAKQFKKHGHDKDEAQHGISPHTMKYGKYRRLLYPYGLCEVKLL